MKVEVTREAERKCKDLIGQAYEAAHARFPDFAGFSGLGVLWKEVEATLKMDITTTGDEDNQAMDIMAEVFGEACRAADEAGDPDRVTDHVDYQVLWEKLMAVLGVEV